MTYPARVRTVSLLSAVVLSALVLCPPGAALAQSDASAVSALSALPVASVVAGGSVVAGSVLVLPVAVSTAGAVLIIKTVESTARGTLCVLERVSDGTRVSLEISAASATGVSLVAGGAVTVSVIGTSVMLSTLGEVIAFVPNALGTALLHNERLTY